MMIYTTYTAAAQFRSARKPTSRHPDGGRIIESSTPSAERSGDRKRRVRRLVTEAAVTS